MTRTKQGFQPRPHLAHRLRGRFGNEVRDFLRGRSSADVTSLYEEVALLKIVVGDLLDVYSSVDSIEKTIDGKDITDADRAELRLQALTLVRPALDELRRTAVAAAQVDAANRTSAAAMTAAALVDHAVTIAREICGQPFANLAEQFEEVLRDSVEVWDETSGVSMHSQGERQSALEDQRTMLRTVPPPPS